MVLVDVVKDFTRRFHRQRVDCQTTAIGWNGGDAGGDADADVVEVAQLLHHGVYLLGVGSLRIKDGLGVIEEQENILRGQERPQRSQILRVFYAGADGLGELREEIGKGRREFVAMDKSAVVAKSFFDAVVVKDGEGDSGFPDSPCTNESNGLESVDEFNDLLDQGVASEKRLRCRGRYLSDRNAIEVLDYGSTALVVADLA